MIVPAGSPLAFATGSRVGATVGTVVGSGVGSAVGSGTTLGAGAASGLVVLARTAAVATGVAVGSAIGATDAGRATANTRLPPTNATSKAKAAESGAGDRCRDWTTRMRAVAGGSSDLFATIATRRPTSRRWSRTDVAISARAVTRGADDGNRILTTGTRGIAGNQATGNATRTSPNRWARTAMPRTNAATSARNARRGAGDGHRNRMTRADAGTRGAGGETRDPEVGDLRPALAVQQHVVGLQVSMQDAAEMGGLQTVGDRGGDLGGGVLIDAAAGPH